MQLFYTLWGEKAQWFVGVFGAVGSRERHVGGDDAGGVAELEGADYFHSGGGLKRAVIDRAGVACPVDQERFIAAACFCDSRILICRRWSAWLLASADVL